MNHNITYKKVVASLRTVSPVIENPEELTQSILMRIERIEKVKTQRKIMRITGLLSGTAACLLLCLLLFEPVQSPAYRYADTKETKQIYSTNKPETIGIAGIIEEKLKNRNRKKQIYSACLHKLNEETKQSYKIISYENN